MQCPACDVSLPENARFCLQCGTPASPSASEPPDPLREKLKVALGQQYELIRLLGRGGMGAVYLARETALEREVAIKVLTPDLSMNREGRERFRREARTAARLSHPNIVPLHTFGEVEGTLFFVMGYVRGESLATRLKREGRLDAEEARRILSEIADALEYAHGLGIIHRDIKPDNVLIDADSGRAMLTDFGVAKTVGAGQTMTSQGSLLGTPQYMSPEQAQGLSDIDRRSDIYSLGVMGYAMLAGRVPFEGNTTSEVLLQHITREPPALRTVAPDVPPEMVAAIARCLVKDPAQRWADAKMFRSALASPDDDEVPLVLDGVHRFTLFFVACLLVLWYLGVWWAAGGDVSSSFLIIIAVIVGFQMIILPLAVVEKTWAARKSGFGFDRVLYEILRQPAVWTARYPRRFRRRGDVWDRLPLELRRARNAMVASVVSMILLILPALLVMSAYESHVRRNGVAPYSKTIAKIVSLSMISVSVMMFFAMMILMVVWDRRAKALGAHDPYVRTHMLSVPAFKRAFWLKPESAVVLSPEPERRTRVSSTQPELSPILSDAPTEALPNRE